MDAITETEAPKRRRSLRPAVEPLTYSIAGACAALNCCKVKIYELIRTGKLDARKLDGKTLITAASLRELVEALPRAEMKEAAP